MSGTGMSDGGGGSGLDIARHDAGVARSGPRGELPASGSVPGPDGARSGSRGKGEGPRQTRPRRAQQTAALLAVRSAPLGRTACSPDAFRARLGAALAAPGDGSRAHALCLVRIRHPALAANGGQAAHPGDEEETRRAIAALVAEGVRGTDPLAWLDPDTLALLLEHCSFEDAQAVGAAIETLLGAWLAPQGREQTAMAPPPVSRRPAADPGDADGSTKAGLPPGASPPVDSAGASISVSVSALERNSPLVEAVLKARRRPPCTEGRPEQHGDDG